MRLRLILIAAVVSLAALSHAPAALAACSANTANLGKVDGSFNLSGTTTQNYHVWSRISVPAINNGYTLNFDELAANAQCNLTAGGTGVSTLNTWTWVQLQGNATVSLAAGNHSYTMYGRDPNVKVDRVIFTADATCVPNNTVDPVAKTVGDNCLAAPPDTQAPSVPTNLTAPAKTSSSVTLSWGASTDNVAVTGYKVYRGTTMVKQVAATTLTYTDTGLTAATNYNYQVTAIDAVPNESTKTAILSVNTDVGTPPPDTTKPSTPTNLVSTGKSATNISMGWSASTDNIAVTGYRIYRNNSTTPLITLNASTRAYNDVSVVGSTTYTYNVTAFDAAGNESLKSTTLTVTTNAPVTPTVGELDGLAPVNYKDLTILLANYGKTTSVGELDGIAPVNYKDLTILLANYGK